MTLTARPDDLTGQMLIAMPGMGDPRFASGLVLICSHSAEGAMGLIVNKPLPELALSDMLAQLEIAGHDACAQVPICFGGPVERQRGFVLHDARYSGRQGDALEIDGRFAVTATLDVMEDMARGEGPTQALVALGYAGWGPGQLESEIAENGWLTCDASEALVFETPMEAKWEAALESLGVHPLTLSAEAGRA